MIATSFLSTKLFPLKPNDTAKMASEWMDELSVAWLPVVEEGKHLGYVSSAHLLDAGKAKKVRQILMAAPDAVVFEHQHWFEIIRVFSEIESTVVSVVNEERAFVGIIAAKELIKHLSSFNAFHEAGSILTIEMGFYDYSLSELARILEYNNAKVLSLYVQADPVTLVTQVHVKLNTHDLRSIMSTLQRYGYKVAASYVQEDDISDLRDRYGLLMRYLDIEE